jgi:hypothetical protein
MNPKLVTAVRCLMGVIYLVSGVNWWFKMITPYPSISDVVGALIGTGVLFHIVKATELLAGLALLTNRLVPMMLVVVLPVTIPIFIVDVFFIAHLRGIIMGSGSLVLNLFMLLAYIGHYRGLLAIRSTPDLTCTATPVSDDSSLAPRIARLLRPAMPAFAVMALVLGLAMLGWIAVMIGQYIVNPLPLSALHPPLAVK